MYVVVSSLLYLDYCTFASATRFKKRTVNIAVYGRVVQSTVT